jgi:hypothetical protein
LTHQRAQVLTYWAERPDREYICLSGIGHVFPPQLLDGLSSVLPDLKPWLLVGCQIRPPEAWPNSQNIQLMGYLFQIITDDLPVAYLCYGKADWNPLQLTV